MVTTISGLPFNSITYIDDVSINDILSYMGTTITPPYVNRYLTVGNFGSFKTPSFPRILATDLSGSVDTTFNMGIGFNSVVRCMATQSDGKIIVGGDFTSYSGSSTNYLVRINPNGTKDTTFTATVNSGVYCVAIQSDNKVVIGGNFTTINAVAVPRIGRLTSTGTRDTTFNPGTAGASSTVRDLKIQSDGKIIVTGAFTSYSGSARNYIVRTNNSGSIDTAFNVGTGFNATSYNCDILSDGKIIVSGTWSTYSGSATNRIIRLNTNGTKDTTFNIGTGFDNVTNTSKVRSDGKILVGGQFTSYNGSSNNYIVRLNSDGTKDTTFNVGTGLDKTWGAGITNGISFGTNGNTYLTSDSLTYSGSIVNNIFKLKDNGTIDTTFDSGVGLDAFGIALLVSSSRIYVGGTFLAYKYPNARKISMIDETGEISSSFNMGIGFNAIVYKCLQQSDKKIVVAGTQTFYNATSSNYLTRLNPDGTKDSTFNIGVGFNNQCTSVSKQTDGKLIVGGVFSSFSGSTINNILRLNTSGSRDTSFNVGTGANGAVSHIISQTDGKTLIVGAFTTYNGSTVNRIARLNSDGTRDTTFNMGVGFGGQVMYAVTQSDGKYITIGSFTTYSGSTTNYIARLNTDGTKDTTFNIGTGFNNSALSLAIQSDGKIISTGIFTSYSGSSSNYIIRLNPNGTKDTTFNVGTGLNTLGGSYPGITIDSDGIIYCTGNFASYSGSQSHGIVSINPSGSINTVFNLGTASFNSTGKGYSYSADVSQIIPVI